MPFKEQRSTLLNRCKWETATDYGHYYFGELLIPLLQNLGIPVVDLEGPSATTVIYQAQIKEKDPILISGCGHGSNDTHHGQWNQELLRRGDQTSADLLAGRYFSALTCDFGLSAEWFIEHGAKGFFGYTVPFTFVAGTFPNSWARPFFEAHISWEQNWTRGKISRDTWEANSLAWDRAIAVLPDWAARYAIANKQGRVYKGDLDSGPYAPPPPTFKCCFCEKTFETCEKRAYHERDDHLGCPPIPGRPAWCKIFGRLVDCPLP